MSFLSQESEKILTEQALFLPQDTVAGNINVNTYDQSMSKRVFTIVETQDGGWKVNVDMSMTLQGIAFAPKENSRTDPIVLLGQGSMFHGHAEFKISGEEIARLSEVDAARFIDETEVPAVDVEASVVYDLKPRVN
jgi:hypothetical protein